MSTNITSPQASRTQINGGADTRDGPDNYSSTAPTGNHASSDLPSKQTGVHPSAVGSATTPNIGSSPGNHTNGDTTKDPETMPGLDEGYPEQKHAGKVGYGPNYNQGAGFTDKVVGLKEEVKGKLTKNHELVERGKDRRTGELKRKEKENDDDDPFATPEEKKSPPLEDTNETSSSKSSQEEERGDKEEAATVSPEGTEQSEKQRKGEAVNHVKQIG
ncbi:hypothetical protein BDZ94DRAFT_1296101 [Collybia nuda]|uniref:Uncharacterized protein n=1 Tax=Collybia nuda TaxID=64659 RepID=A0A9P5YDJ3_9AGAR|nr:hypothetical protein BDZ94DRAFT_1296101 [Collybia nuda]